MIPEFIVRKFLSDRQIHKPIEAFCFTYRLRYFAAASFENKIL